MKKLILLDTNILMGKKFDSLKEQHPFSEWSWVISGDTFFEFTNGNREGKSYKEILYLYNNLSLRTILDFYNIVDLECKSILRKGKNFKILYPEDWEIALKECLEGKDPRWTEKLELRRNIWMKCQNSDIQPTDKSPNCLKIRKIEIEEQVSIAIQDAIENDRVDTFDKEIQNTYKSIRQILISYKDRISELALSYPATYSLFKIQGLSNTLRKPKDREAFYFQVVNYTSKIKVDENYIIDLRISAAALAYVDKFITRDSGLVKILRLLFPQYKEKVILDTDIRC